MPPVYKVMLDPVLVGGKFIRVLDINFLDQQFFCLCHITRLILCEIFDGHKQTAIQKIQQPTLPSQIFFQLHHCQFSPPHHLLHWRSNPLLIPLKTASSIPCGFVLMKQIFVWDLSGWENPCKQLAHSGFSQQFLYWKWATIRFFHQNIKTKQQHPSHNGIHHSSDNGNGRRSVDGMSSSVCKSYPSSICSKSSRSIYLWIDLQLHS